MFYLENSKIKEKYLISYPVNIWYNQHSYILDIWSNQHSKEKKNCCSEYVHFMSCAYREVKAVVCNENISFQESNLDSLLLGLTLKNLLFA